MNPDQSSKFSKKLSGSWLINNFAILKLEIKISRTTALEFQDFPGFSRTYAFFQDFPGLEISTIKFQDFPGLSRVCTNPVNSVK